MTTPVAIIMGSQSDWETMRHAAETLDALGVAFETRIVSAHRTPDRLFAFAKGAKAAGFKVIIAGAGGAAHLPGMTASLTELPVFGVPVESIDIVAGEGARLTLTSAAAEKVYRTESSASVLNIALKAQAHSHLAWLPQETILFDRARVLRHIDIDLAETASLLFCEIVVFGRAAMGERMQRGEFVDHWRMRRGGRLVFAENIHLDGDIGEKLARPAIANGGTAIGTALVVPGDEALVERIRGLSESLAGEVGISAWNGFAMARFCAQDAAALRADMTAVLGRASSSALPRLWLN